MERPDKYYEVRDIGDGRGDCPYNKMDGQIYQRDPKDMTKTFTVIEFLYSDPSHRRQVKWFKARDKAEAHKFTLNLKAWEAWETVTA